MNLAFYELSVKHEPPWRHPPRNGELLFCRDPLREDLGQRHAFRKSKGPIRLIADLCCRVNAKAPEDRGRHVAGRYGISRRVGGHFVAAPEDGTAAHAAAGQARGIAVGPMAA